MHNFKLGSERFICIDIVGTFDRDTFTPILFVKELEHADTFCKSFGTIYRVSEHHPLAFCILLQYHYIRHEVVFHV